MIRASIVSGLALLLTACAPAKETAGQLATDFKDNVYTTSAKLKEWAMTPPPEKGAPQPVPASYCYRAYEDIICYRRPMPGWEHRLVGWQGTGAEPPPPAVMQPLAMVPPEDGQPVSHVADVQPVFVAPPPEVKGTDKAASSVAEVPDATHEQLPNPATVPQL